MKKVRMRGSDVSVEEFVKNYVMEGEDDFYNRRNGIEDRIERLANILGGLISYLSATATSPLSDAAVIAVVLGQYHYSKCEIVNVNDEE